MNTDCWKDFRLPHPDPHPEDRSSAVFGAALPQELSARIRSCAARMRVPPGAAFAAAFTLYLSRICGAALADGTFDTLCQRLAAERVELAGGAFVYSPEPPEEKPPAQLSALLLAQAEELPGGQYRLCLHYRRGYFAAGEPEEFARHVRRILEEAAIKIGAPLRELCDWPPDEERRARQGFSKPAMPAESAAARFERAAAAFPQRAALICAGERTTYRELENASRRVARALIGLGADAGEPVALLLGRTPDLPAAILGAMRAGCAFLPLSPLDPEERNRYILTDSRVRFCLTDGARDLPDGCRAIAMQSLPQADGARRAHDAGPNAACCLLYVMGASGKPEGVRMPRRAIDRLADPSCSPYHRAVSTCGHAVAARACAASGRFLLELLPALLNGVTVALDGAESASVLKVFQIYGSEETGLCTACDAVPAAGAPLYVLAPDGGLLPPGAEGELAAGGDGVMLPAPGAERFTWAGRTRVFRTGDTGYLLPDGTLRLTGRLDRRVLRAGERVEPAEIEKRLACAPGIGSCAALMRGGKLFCFYTARREFSPEAARAYIGRFLPPFAAPDAVYCLPRMPLDEHGNPDYGALGSMELPAGGESPAADGAERGADDISLYDYRGIRKLLARNRPPAPDGREGLGSILLTGATGYLGAHILYELALKYHDTIYCLVRPKDGIDAEKRLKSRLFYYFETSFQSLFGSRIFVVEGNLARPGLGLGRDLPKIDTVLNCAGLPPHAEVAGTRRLIALCRERNARLIHISALGVAGCIPPHKKREGIVFSECGLYVGQSVADPALKSKFLAERAVLEAVCGGLHAKVLRLETLQGRFSDGEFQMNLSSNRFTRQLRSCALTGICSEEFAAMEVRFTPVDLAAAAVLLLARMPQRACVFHVVDEHGLPVSLFLERLERLCHPVRILPDSDFAERMERLARTDEGREAAGGFLRGPAGEKGLVKTPCVSGFSLGCLHRFGFEWPRLAGGYLDRLMTGLDSFGLFG